MHLSIRIVVSALLICFSLSGRAQSPGGGEETRRKVSGVVLEKGAETPLSLCRIAAYTADGKRAGRTVSLDNGTFRLLLPDGSYDLLFESTGHKSVTLKLPVEGEDVPLGKIRMEIGEELNAAGVESKTLIHRQGTRITYDVSKDPDASKINMTQMASRIPELHFSARNGKLELNEQAFDKILIDEEENGLINAARQYPMEFIKADYMRKIEIVLPGDLEYNNDKPIMLISLSRPLPYGFAGNLHARSNTRNNHSPQLDLVANTPLIGVGLGYSYSYSGEPALTNESIMEMEDRIVNNYSSSQSRSNGHNFHTNLFRDIVNDRVKFNATLRGSFSDGSSLSESGTTITSGTGEIIENSVTTSTGSTKSPFRLGGALRLSGDFGKQVGRRRANSWRVEYSYNNSLSDSIMEYSDIGTQTSKNGQEEHKAVATLTLKSFKNVSMTSKGGFYGRHYSNMTQAPSYERGMDYRQNVGFIDVTALGSIFDRKLSYLLKLNNEYLSNKGEFVMDDLTSPLDWDEFNVNPLAGLTWNFKRSSLGLSYGHHVNRPSPSQLNPYVDRSNPYLLKTGNPGLKGSKTQNVSLNYLVRPALKWVRGFSIMGTWSWSNNTIAAITSADASGVATRSFDNIGKNKSLNIKAQADLAPAKKLTINLLASCGKSWVTLPDRSDNSFLSPALHAGVSWNPEWFDMHAGISLNPSLSSVQSAKLIMEPMGDLSLSHYFAKAHLGISASVNDLFHSGGRKESVISYGNFTQYNYIERRGRTFSFHIYWSFGHFRQTETVEVKAYDM